MTPSMGLFKEEEKSNIVFHILFEYLQICNRNVVIGLLNALPTLSDGEIIQFPGGITELGDNF